MKGIKSYIRRLSQRSLMIGGGVLAVVVIGGGIIYSKNNSKNTFDTEEVHRRDISQVIRVTGKAQASQDIDLAFEKGGRVAGIYVKVGQKVSQGMILAELSRGDLSANLLEAEASVRSQEAKLDEVKRGSRPEEIQRGEVRVTNAQTLLDDAKKGLSNELADAYTSADDAIRNKADQIFLNPRSQNPQLNISADLQLKTDVESARLSLEYKLQSWAAASNLDSTAVRKNLSDIKTFLSKMALVVNQLTPNSSITQTTIDKYKTDILTARTSIDASVAGIISAEEKSRTAESALSLASEDLSVLKAGNSPEQIREQEAEVERAVSSVKNIQAEIEKAIIRAPINGIITIVNADPGEIVAPNVSLISLISDSQYEVEANVPEVDIAKLKLASPAVVTLDAYGDGEKFSATVVRIDPAETIVNSVATYKVVLQFVEQDPRIKSGMTANIDITTDTHSSALAVPQRAVIVKDNKKIVRIPDGEKSFKEREVKTGLRGSDGYIEILEGISENERIITSNVQ